MSRLHRKALSEADRQRITTAAIAEKEAARIAAKIAEATHSADAHGDEVQGCQTMHHKALLKRQAGMDATNGEALQTDTQIIDNLQSQHNLTPQAASLQSSPSRGSSVSRGPSPVEQTVTGVCALSQISTLGGAYC